MTQDELYASLDYVNHSREKRAEMSGLILDNPHLVKLLMAFAFDVDDPISSRACWVMEFAAKEDLNYVLPYIDEFTGNLGKVHVDSAVRPVAKICEYLIDAYFSETRNSEPQNSETRNSKPRNSETQNSKTPNKVQETLTEVHLEHIVTACFDWLIGEHKVAPQAYAMTCLLLLGRRFDWIYPELKMILEKNYAQGSPAYKARARMTLAALK